MNILMIEDTLRHNSLLKLIIEGHVDGKTKGGREWMECNSRIMKDMNVESYRDLKELSCDRETWRAVANQPRERRPKKLKFQKQ